MGTVSVAALLVMPSILLWFLLHSLVARMGLARAVLSPLAYFSLLWWLAFPFHAFLLFHGLADTQQKIDIAQGALFAAVWISVACLLMVWQGASCRRDNCGFVEGSWRKTEIDKISIHRVMLVLVGLIACVVFFLSQTLFQTGEFQIYVGNEQNEARVGHGPLFVLSEMFVYGLVAVAPLLVVRRDWSPAKILLLLLFCIGLLFSVYVGMALTSRRIIVLPLFVMALAWMYTRPRINALMATLLIASSVFAAPVLQGLRYALTPTPTPTPTHVANYCAFIGGHLAPQKSLRVLDAHGGQRGLFELTVQLAQHACEPAHYATYFVVQTTASSYGLVDHLATFLQKATPMDILTGVDSGKAWAYNILLAAIPRSVWSDKPLHYGSVAEQKWLYPRMYQDKQVTMTLPPSFIVDFLFGFGVVSLLVLCYGMGRLLAWMHVALFEAGESRNYIRFVFSLFLMAYLFNIVRGGTGFFQAVLPMIVVLIMMYGLRPLSNLFTRRGG